MSILSTPLTNSSKTTNEPNISAADLVFWGIVRGLETQQFVAGQRLVETDLASRFGVGRNAVREAMQRLSAEGLVDLSRHKGASIRVFTMSEALDLLDIVERILGLLTRTAARGYENKELAKNLEEIFIDIENADEQRDANMFSVARRAFYKTLQAMGGNRDLNRLITTIHIPILFTQQHVPSLQKIRLIDYKNIISAVLSGNADLAEQAGTNHVKNVRSALLSTIYKNGN